MSDYPSPEVLHSELVLAGSARLCQPVTPIGGSATDQGRPSRADWVEAATEVLAGQGFCALAVTPTAERLGVPEGTFYTQFESPEDLVGAVLQRWKAIDTDDMLKSLNRIAEPRERLARFVELSFERHHWGRVFAALSAMALHPRVGPVMTAIREARLAYLERDLSELGLSDPHARDRAALIYTAYVGFWGLVADDPDFEYNDARLLHGVAEHIKSTLIPSEG